MATAGRGPETSHPTGSAHGHPVGGWAPSPEPTRRGPRLPAVLCLPVAAAAFGTSVVLEAEFSGRHAPETIFGVLLAGLAGGLCLFVVALPFAQRRVSIRAARIEGAVGAGTPLSEVDWDGPRDVLREPRPLGPTLSPATSTLWGMAWGLAWVGPAAVRVLLSWTVVAAVAGLLVLLTLWELVRNVGRGSVLVRLDAFPVRPGSSVTFWVATSEGGSRLEGASALLRCVTGPRVRYGVLWCTELWSDEVRIARDRAPGPVEFVPVTFQVPADVPDTFLHHADRPVRWELVVTGRTAWGRLAEQIVVPVYADRTAPAAEAT